MIYLFFFAFTNQNTRSLQGVSSYPSTLVIDQSAGLGWHKLFGRSCCVDHVFVRDGSLPFR